MNKLKKAVNITKNGLVTLAAFIVVFFAASRILPNFKYGLYMIQSGSMQPTIKIGSVAVDKKLDRYKKGDIITYKQFEKIITHRVDSVLEKEGKFFYRTKGDANNGSDLILVNQNDVLGKVIFPIPYLGYLMNFARTKLGIFLLILIPSVWVIVLEAIEIKKELAKNRLRGNKEKNDENK